MAECSVVLEEARAAARAGPRAAPVTHDTDNHASTMRELRVELASALGVCSVAAGAGSLFSLTEGLCV